MNSLRENKEIKHIRFSVGSFERPAKLEFDLNGNYPPAGLLENIYFEKGEIENLFDVHLSFADYIDFYPSVKIERILWQ